MPASRSARAIILAPRSCPSSPGFAIKTRIFFSGMKRSGDGDFFVGAEDFAHGVADFAESGVGFYGVEEVGHQIFGALRGFAQCAEATRDFIAGALGAQLAQALCLPRCHRL